MDRWIGGGSFGLGVSYHSLGENMMSEEFLKFMFGLEKKSIDSDYHIA